MTRKGSSYRVLLGTRGTNVVATLYNWVRAKQVAL